jgi:hypothetical protein
VRAEAAGVSEKLRLYLGYSHITDFFPVFQFLSPGTFSFSLYQDCFLNNVGRNVSMSLKCKKILGFFEI